HYDVAQGGIGPRLKIRQSGLLPPFAQGHGHWITFSGISMAADLQPGLLSLVPSKQDPLGRGMDNER
ncbi:MAG TPA: hypothetical protein VGW74_10690, partial [Propionibacteriaceae bacterium]|nr:hypothetical protein [Propionibacteriaceae bacterium]